MMRMIGSSFSSASLQQQPQPQRGIVGTTMKRWFYAILTTSTARTITAIRKSQAASRSTSTIVFTMQPRQSFVASVSTSSLPLSSLSSLSPLAFVVPSNNPPILRSTTTTTTTTTTSPRRSQQPVSTLAATTSKTTTAMTMTIRRLNLDHTASPSSSYSRSYSSTPTQLFLGRSNSNNDGTPNHPNKKRGGFWNSVKNVAKKVLPSKWVLSPEEQREEERRKERQQMIQQQEKEITGGLSELLKDAPFPVRMLGNLVTPLLRGALSEAADLMRQQQGTVLQMIDQATTCIEQDEAVQQALAGGSGGTIRVSATPFSQSSSSSTINGRTTQRVEIALQVMGSQDSGIATISANEDGLQSIRLQCNRSGRLLQVSTMIMSGGGGSSNNRIQYNNNKNSKKEDNIIDAEIIEEKNPPKP